LLTKKERYQQIIKTWSDMKDKIQKLSKESLNKTGPVASMIDSGARGSVGQLTQVVGMKGLVSNPKGELIELPIKSSFREGLDVLEYFISTHGTRKGLTDTALKTAKPATFGGRPSPDPARRARPARQDDRSKRCTSGDDH
jgi:DNA-directed RNA polymerase subunit beta'